MIKYNSIEIGSSHCNKMNDCEKIWMKFYKKKGSLILEFRKIVNLRIVSLYKNSYSVDEPHIELEFDNFGYHIEFLFDRDDPSNNYYLVK